VLTAEVLETIEAIVRHPSTEQRVANRGQAVSLMAAAMGTSDIAMLVGVNERTGRKGKNGAARRRGNLFAARTGAHRVQRPVRTQHR
jgi:hypothetical protein